ncbi:hypothetical protein EON64_05130 [archaeon]|nr:MAG: hypothetical protein EON64_05130 [archaeon]
MTLCAHARARARVQNVESLVVAKHGARLYAEVQQRVASQAAATIRALDAQSADANTFLPLVYDGWLTFSSRLILIRNVFLYLDRTYVRDTAGLKPIWCVLPHAHPNICTACAHWCA